MVSAENVARELIAFDLQVRLKRKVVHGVEGMVMMLTLGTGVGAALLTQGGPMPDTEFGHIMMRDREDSAGPNAERRRNSGAALAPEAVRQAFTLG